MSAATNRGRRPSATPDQAQLAQTQGRDSNKGRRDSSASTVAANDDTDTDAAESEDERATEMASRRPSSYQHGTAEYDPVLAAADSAVDLAPIAAATSHGVHKKDEVAILDAPAPPTRGGKPTFSAATRVSMLPSLAARLIELLDEDCDTADIRRQRLHRQYAGVNSVWREAAHLRLATIMVVAVPHPQAVTDIVTRGEAQVEALAELRAEQPLCVGAMPARTLIYASALRHLQLHDLRLGDLELRILANNVRGLAHLALHECLLGSPLEVARWLRGSRDSMHTLCIVSSRPPVMLDDAALARWSQAVPMLRDLTLIFPHVPADMRHTRGLGGGAKGSSAAEFAGPVAAAANHYAAYMPSAGLPNAGQQQHHALRSGVVQSSMPATSLAPGSSVFSPAGLHTLAANCPRLRHLALDVPSSRGLALDDLVASLYMLRRLRFVALGATPVRVPLPELPNGVPPEIHVPETVSLLFPFVRFAAMDPDAVGIIDDRPPVRARAATLPALPSLGLFATSSGAAGAPVPAAASTASGAIWGSFASVAGTVASRWNSTPPATPSASQSQFGFGGGGAAAAAQPPLPPPKDGSEARPSYQWGTSSSGGWLSGWGGASAQSTDPASTASPISATPAASATSVSSTGQQQRGGGVGWNVATGWLPQAISASWTSSVPPTAAAAAAPPAPGTAPAH
ncbi:hypothetical protein BC828DRAFT_383287 [Blastocladiella britannica]|nr:hypothetical protein BC828DRAFT_383287 [Blastocladiella britannica]